jgi:uncharacterized membrane protein YhaH (DUF805 family)
MRSSFYDLTPFGRSVEPMSPRQILWRFEGRIARRTWWLYAAGLVGVGLVGTVLLRVVGFGAYASDALVNLALLWPALAVSVKRWHDRDKSAWWLLVNLLPLVGWLWALLENGMLRGTRGANRFGPGPDQ